MSNTLIQRTLETDNSLAGLALRIPAGIILSPTVLRNCSEPSAAMVWKAPGSGWRLSDSSRDT